MISGMTLYEFLLFVHIVCIAVWMGGGMVNAIFIKTAAGLTSTAAIAPIARRAHALGNMVFAPASILALATGIWLVIEGPWSFSDTWISIGFTGIIVAIVIGAVFHSKRGARAVELAEADDLPALQQHLHGWVQLARVDLLLITLVILDMVVKPGT